MDILKNRQIVKMVMLEVSWAIAGLLVTVFYFTCIPEKQVDETHSILNEYYDNSFLRTYTPPVKYGKREDEYYFI